MRTQRVRSTLKLTPAYASREMLDDLEPEPSDDLFALGCITYELLTGVHAYGQPANTIRCGTDELQAPPQLDRRQWRALKAAFSISGYLERTQLAELESLKVAQARGPYNERNSLIEIARNLELEKAVFVNELEQQLAVALDAMRLQPSLTRQLK